MAHLFIATTRRTTGRWAVRAFTTPTNRRQVFTVARRTFSSGETQQTPLQASTQVEDDLDSALNDIMGDVFAELDGGAPETVESQKEGFFESEKLDVAKPELEELDLEDPNVLSIMNPRWVNAGLDPRIIEILSGKGIAKFTPVQAEAFDPVVSGRDVIGRSRTGTGKTLAFALPGITRIVQLAKKNGNMDRQGRMRRGRLPSMLVLCPTRELARQVQEEIFQVAKPLGLFADVFHGGVSYDPQARNLRNGIDILVGTPGRVIDHIERGNLDLSECHTAVLDEADEMLNMGFADDVEVILEGIGSRNDEKTQCLLFSATTPPWVKNIGRQYQQDALQIDSTGQDTGARTATTVRHTAIKVPRGQNAKTQILEDIIAIEISKDIDADDTPVEEENDELIDNPIAAAALAEKKKSSGAMQQKIFGKTIVFTETKKQADELVSGGVFKSLTAQALHGDVGQKQRDATLNAFRKGSFNVLVATDVAARGIDIKDVDLVVQLDPPRDVDTYVHRSGRTGRAGSKGVSVLLFDERQSRDIVKIERDLGHGFQFELLGPPSTEAALRAAAKTSAIACNSIPDETAQYFKESAVRLLENAESAEDVVARCLAAISRRSSDVETRSLLTGEVGLVTIEMTNDHGRPVSVRDVMFTVGKLSRMSQRDEEHAFDADVGKIEMNEENGSAIFDLAADDAKKLLEFSKDVEAGGAVFNILQEMEVERGNNFGREFNRRNGRGWDRRGGGGGGGDRRGGGGRGYQGRGGGSRRGNDRDYRGGGYSRGYNEGRFSSPRGQRNGDRFSGGSNRRSYSTRRQNDGDGW